MAAGEARAGQREWGGAGRGRCLGIVAVTCGMAVRLGQQGQVRSRWNARADSGAGEYAVG
jgi:hypothetical protein